MKQRRRSLVCLLIFSVALVTSCNKSEPPPPPKTEPPKAAAPAAPDVNAEMKRVAAEVYVYAFPMVLTDVTREVESAGVAPNTFAPKGAVADASSTDVNPNA